MRNTRLGQALEPLVPRRAGDDVADHLVDLVVVRSPRGDGGEARILDPFGFAHRDGAELLPAAVVGHHDADVSVVGGEVGADGTQVLVAHAAQRGFLTGVPCVVREVAEPG